MGFFDLFAPKSRREPDKIWLNENAKLDGLCGDIAACLKHKQPVFAVSFHLKPLEELAARLAQRSLRPSGPVREYPPSAGELWSSPEPLLCLWPSTIRAFVPAPPSALPAHKLEALWIFAVEHDLSPERDRSLLDYAAALPGPSRTRFYGALDDPLLKAVGADRLGALLKSLGATEQKPIESSLVSRQIAAAQARLAKARERGES